MAKRQGSIWKSAALAAALASAPLLAHAAERLVIPFHISELEHMVVRLEINGTTVTTGVVDTAATFAMVDSRTAIQSGVAAPDAESEKVSILGVNGAKTYPIVRLDSVKTGNVRLGALEAAYSRDLDIPGTAANVLPSSAFPGDVLEFDFRNRLISVYDGRPDRPTTTYHDSVPYKLDGGLMYVDIRINCRYVIRRRWRRRTSTPSRCGPRSGTGTSLPAGCSCRPRRLPGSSRSCGRWGTR